MLNGKECTFSIDHHVVEDYLKYCRVLAYGFYKIHRYILPGSQKTPESSRKVKTTSVRRPSCYKGLFTIYGLEAESKVAAKHLDCM